MNSKLIKTLTTVCLVLILIIVFEWLYTMRTQKQLLNSMSAAAKQTLPDDMPAINLNAQPEASYADLVNRPLFIKGRRPVAESEQAAVTNSSEWLLSGIYTTQKGLMALLTRAVATTTPADNYRKVTLGAEFDGWKVAEIHNDKILLTQGVTEKELLLRKPKEKVKETQAAEDDRPRNFGDRRTRSMTRTEPAPQTEPEPTDDVSKNDNNARDQ